MRSFLELERNLRILGALTAANMKSRYRNTIWGFVWVLLNPVLTYAVQIFAFTMIFQVRFENYALYLLAGLFPWLFILQSADMCTGLFLNNGMIVKNIPIPPVLLVMVQVLDNFINFVCAFFILIIYFTLFGTLGGWSVLLVILPIFSLLLAVSSLCVLLATLNVWFRDLKFIVSFVFSLLFYLTPIVYSINQVPERFKWILIKNPFYFLIHPFQQLLHASDLTSFSHAMMLSFSFSLALFAVAVLYWRKMKNLMVFYV